MTPLPSAIVFSHQIERRKDEATSSSSSFHNQFLILIPVRRRRLHTRQGKKLEDDSSSVSLDSKASQSQLLHTIMTKKLFFKLKPQKNSKCLRTLFPRIGLITSHFFFVKLLYVLDDRCSLPAFMTRLTRAFLLLSLPTAATEPQTDTDTQHAKSGILLLPFLSHN